MGTGQPGCHDTPVISSASSGLIRSILARNGGRQPASSADAGAAASVPASTAAAAMAKPEIHARLPIVAPLWCELLAVHQMQAADRSQHAAQRASSARSTRSEEHT